MRNRRDYQGAHVDPDDWRATLKQRVDLRSILRRLSRRRAAIGGPLIALAGLLAGGGGALLYLGGAAYDRSDAAQELARLQSERDEGTSRTIGGAVLVGAGGAALVAGVLALAWPRRVEMASRWWLAPAGSGVVAGGRF